MFKKIALIPVLSLCCMVSAFEISTDFPGGNIEVLEKSDNGAKVAQQIRDTSEWWFYWNFEVSGAAGKTLEFKFANGDPAPPQATTAAKLGNGSAPDASSAARIRPPLKCRYRKTHSQPASPSAYHICPRTSTRSQRRFRL